MPVGGGGQQPSIPAARAFPANVSLSVVEVLAASQGRSALSPWDCASCGGHTRNCFGLKGLVELKVLSALNLIYSQRSSDVTCT